jgi:DNA-binding NtrC family response regulator
MATSRVPGLVPTAKVPARLRVLVVEDHRETRESLTALLRGSGFSVIAAASAPEALWALSKTPIDVTLSDLRISGPGGRDLVRSLRAASPGTPLVLLTAPENAATAVPCLRDGASDVVLKPVDALTLEVAFRRALEGRSLRRELRHLRAVTAAAGTPGSPDTMAWRRVLAAADAAAAGEQAVFVGGGPAEARRHVARRIHEHGSRASGPFVRVDCATLGAEAWESELFGHRKGAFEGAAEDVEGYLQLAYGGTVMLDEVAALPASARAAVRRLVEEGRFERLGDVQPTQANVRLILAASAAVPGLGPVAPIHVPPPALPPAPPPAPSPVAPLPPVASPPGRAETPRAAASLNLRESLHQAERALLVEALKRSGGVHRDAARLLGVDPRNLPYFLRKYDLLTAAEPVPFRAGRRRRSSRRAGARSASGHQRRR